MAKTNLHKLKVFPPADLFPLLADDELRDLAADIKENGLRDPVVTATIKGEEMLVDGRNRLAACKIAGVEPQSRALNGEDPTAYVISVNINRRHMTKGQRAMAMAMIHPEPEKGGRGKKGKVNLEFSSMLLSQARTVFAQTPDAAKQVLAGNIPLADAYSRALELKQQGENVGAKLELLRVSAPDLAELVETEKMSSEKAFEEERQRAAEARAAEDNKRETFLRVTAGVCSNLEAFANDEFVAGLKERLKDKAFRVAFVAHVRPQNYKPDLFAGGAQSLARIIRALKKGE
jgi:hypothetical protein